MRERPSLWNRCRTNSGKLGRIHGVAALIAFFAALAALVAARHRHRRRLPPRAMIVSPRTSTVIARDGGVRSVQSADLALDRADLDRLWNPTDLENLARTYWRFAPEYTVEPDHGNVRWRIRDGLLVARAGRGSGYLALDVRRQQNHESDSTAIVHIDVEVANFYPAIAVGFSMPVYEATQSSIHVLVTHAFLRSLTTLDLAESKVGLLGIPPPD
jgi:hypothetical protein